MRVAIIGSGYVGLVTGACLADKGHDVICVDENPDIVAAINRAAPMIHETGLRALLQRNVGSRLQATTDIERAVRSSGMSFITVGTPFDGEQIDLDQVRRAAMQIGSVLGSVSGTHVVVVKSTVVPGTTEEVVLPLITQASGKRAGIDFGIGMNPEFLREGSAVDDCMNPDRIVVGASDWLARTALEKLYAPFENACLLHTDPRTAEAIKYAMNSLLATLISFSNEIGNLCSAIGVDAAEVFRGVCLDRRLAADPADRSRGTPAITTYLEAGCGFGGSCFPKDLNALRAHGWRVGSPMRVLDAVVETNVAQPDNLVGLVRRHFESLEGVRVALLGLSFKPGTDDVRESPAIRVARSLQGLGAIVQAYDPIASSRARVVLGGQGIEYCNSLEAALEGVAAIVIVTRWDEFRSVPELIRGRRPQPLVADGRRMIDPASVDWYEGIGRGDPRRQAMAADERAQGTSRATAFVAG